MTPRTQSTATRILDPAAAYRYWGVPPAEDVDRTLDKYPLGLTEHLLRRFEPGRASDPVALQCMPRARELVPGPDPDPTGDTRCRPVPRLVRKHANRVVLLVANACFLSCRFCFRKAGAFADPDREDTLEASFRYIEGDPRIREVILSGGDPLTLNDRRLGDILDRLHTIPHVTLVRVHTRSLTALPSRITPNLVGLLQRHRPLYLVLHTNHAQEFGPEAHAAIERLLAARIPLLNQSVLLRDVNDDPGTLAELSWELLEHGVTPYYLHHCDRVPGTSDFWTSLEHGLDVYTRLAALVPGHGLPRYVIDLPGGRGKVPVTSGRRLKPGVWRFPLPDGTMAQHEERPL